jgi:hypothetical protein
VTPWTTIASAVTSSTASGTSNVATASAMARSAYPPPSTMATTRRPSGVRPTTSPPGTIGSTLRDKYEFSAWWVSA